MAKLTSNSLQQSLLPCALDKSSLSTGRVTAFLIVLISYLFTGFVERESLDEVCFDWMKLMTYHMDIKTVLQAKTEVTEVPAESLNEGPLAAPKSNAKTSKHPLVPGNNAMVMC